MSIKERHFEVVELANWKQCTVYCYEDGIIKILLEMQKKWWKYQGMSNEELHILIQVNLWQDFTTALHFYKQDQEYLDYIKWEKETIKNYRNATFSF